MVESKLLGRKSEKKIFFGPKPLKTRLSPKLLEIERLSRYFLHVFLRTYGRK